MKRMIDDVLGKIVTARDSFGNIVAVGRCISYCNAPTVSIQTADGSGVTYQTLYTSTNKQQDNYPDVGGFAFYRAKIFTWTVGYKEPNA